jgi:hypothetical protein
MKSKFCDENFHVLVHYMTLYTYSLLVWFVLFHRKERRHFNLARALFCTSLLVPPGTCMHAQLATWRASLISRDRRTASLVCLALFNYSILLCRKPSNFFHFPPSALLLAARARKNKTDLCHHVALKRQSGTMVSERLDLHTLLLLLDSFDADCLIRYGFLWSRKLRCCRTSCRRFQSLILRTLVTTWTRIGKAWYSACSVLPNEESPSTRPFANCLRKLALPWPSMILCCWVATLKEYRYLVDHAVTVHTYCRTCRYRAVDHPSLWFLRRSGYDWHWRTLSYGV